MKLFNKGAQSQYRLFFVTDVPCTIFLNIIDVSHRKVQAAWDIVMTIVLSLGDATHTHDC